MLIAECSKTKLGRKNFRPIEMADSGEPAGAAIRFSRVARGDATPVGSRHGSLAPARGRRGEGFQKLLIAESGLRRMAIKSASSNTRLYYLGGFVAFWLLAI